MQMILNSVSGNGESQTKQPAKGTFGLARPVFVANVAALAALTSAGIAGWEMQPTLVLALIAWIDGLFLTAYLQSKIDNRN